MPTATSAALAFLCLFLFPAAAGAASPPIRPIPIVVGDALAGLWPLPTSVSASGSVPLLLDESSFVIRPSKEYKSSRLTRALARYHDFIFQQKSLWPHLSPGQHQTLQNLVVTISPTAGSAASLDDPPQLDTDESFVLSVSAPSASLNASTVYGVLRGLETFSQLTVRLGDSIMINSSAVKVESAPRFKYRGVMLDSGRHFLPVATLKRAIDGMSFSSLNVLHWHMVDSQSFAWNCSAPGCSRLVAGAFRAPDLVYQRADLEALVEYAADRGVRILPEVDVPSHSASWRFGYPEVTVECGADAGAPDAGHDPTSLGTTASQLDPSSEGTFELIDSIVGELAEIFPDEYLHLGGDEVQVGCYNSSAKVRAFMQSKGFDPSCPPKYSDSAQAQAQPEPELKSSGSSGGGGRGGGRGGSGSDDGGLHVGKNPCGNGGRGYKNLVAYFITRAQAIARKHGRTPCGWQETFDHYGNYSGTPTPPFATLDKGTVLYDWLAPGWGWANPETITAAGWRAVTTLGLYLSSDLDSTDWQQAYSTEPLSSTTNTSAPKGKSYFNVSAHGKEAVERMLGGEVW